MPPIGLTQRRRQEAVCSIPLMQAGFAPLIWTSKWFRSNAIRSKVARHAESQRASRCDPSLRRESLPARRTAAARGDDRASGPAELPAALFADCRGHTRVGDPRLRGGTDHRPLAALYDPAVDPLPG